MELWMEKYDDCTQLIEQVPIEARNVLCVSSVEHCLDFFAPSFEEQFLPVTVDYVRSILPRLRRFAEGREPGELRYSELVDEIHGMQDRHQLV